MKQLFRILPLAAIAALVFSAGCKLIDVKKDINGGSVTFTVATQKMGTYDDSRDVTVDIKEELKKYNVDISKIKKLYMKSAKFSIIDPSVSPVTFDVVDNATVEIGSTSASLPLKKIAWKDPVPHTGLTSVDAEVDSSIDLVPFANAGNVQYHVFGTLNSDLDHEIQIKSEFTWTVEF